MSIIVLKVESDDDVYGLLIDTVTERPVPVPLFAGGPDAAKDFLEFARLAMNGDHLETLKAPLWDRIHDAWLRAACSACWRRDCACPWCGCQCDVGHTVDCREVRP
jgi:hypothetical protein